MDASLKVFGRFQHVPWPISNGVENQHDLALIVNVFFRLDVYVLRKIQDNPQRRALLSSTAHFYT